MKASELRIGNWVKINDGYFEDGKEIGYDLYKTNEFQIMGFNDGSFTEGCKVICFYEIPSEIGGLVHGGCRDLDIDPIPLTEEWLLKFGFTEHKTTDIYPTFAKQMFNWNDGILYIIGYGFMNHIKYVHQLQNLYFALTEEELKIKD
jgi:hypothetical protein